MDLLALKYHKPNLRESRKNFVVCQFGQDINPIFQDDFKQLAAAKGRFSSSIIDALTHAFMKEKRLLTNHAKKSRSISSTPPAPLQLARWMGDASSTRLRGHVRRELPTLELDAMCVDEVQGLTHLRLQKLPMYFALWEKLSVCWNK